MPRTRRQIDRRVSGSPFSVRDTRYTKLERDIRVRNSTITTSYSHVFSFYFILQWCCLAIFLTRPRHRENRHWHLAPPLFDPAVIGKPLWQTAVANRWIDETVDRRKKMAAVCSMTPQLALWVSNMARLRGRMTLLILCCIIFIVCPMVQLYDLGGTDYSSYFGRRPTVHAHAQSSIDSPCRGFPSTNNIVVSLKTRAANAHARLPLHLLTHLQCVPDVLLFSDMVGISDCLFPCPSLLSLPLSDRTSIGTASRWSPCP